MPPLTDVQTAQDAGLATEDILIFVSSSGADSNPGTKDQPLLTFEEAIRRLQPLWRRQQRIKLLPGTYTISKPVLEIYLGQLVGAEAGRLVIEGGFSSVAGDRKVTATSAGSHPVSVTDATLALAADALVGARLRFTSGVLSGQAYLVAANTNNTLTVNGSLSAAPAPGDSFVIERPNVTLEPDFGMAFYGSSATQLVMLGLRFHPKKTGPNAFFQLSGGMQVWAEGCEWDMNGGIFQVVEHCILTAGGVQGLAVVDDVATPLRSSGCYIQNGFKGGKAVDEAAGFRASQGFIWGSWVARNTDINVQGGGMLLTLTANGCGLTVDGFYGSSYLELTGPGWIADVPDQDAIQVSRGGHLKVSNMEIRNAKLNAIFVDQDSLALLRVTRGKGNQQFGLRADHGARVRIETRSGSPTVSMTGALGDILLGSTKHSWSEVPAGISDPATFTRIESM